MSEMTWMRGQVLRSVKGMTQDRLRLLLESERRTAIRRLHPALGSRWSGYELNTFDNVGLANLEKVEAFKEWDVCRWN